MDRSRPPYGLPCEKCGRNRRLKSCVARWPECADDEYNPACCRFPKVCSCEAFHEGWNPDDFEKCPICASSPSRSAVVDESTADELTKAAQTISGLVAALNEANDRARLADIKRDAVREAAYAGSTGDPNFALVKILAVLGPGR